MAIELPAGQYIHFCRAVRTTSGGRTRAVLMRARLLAQHAGVPTVITTYDDKPVYSRTRAELSEQGLLSDDVALQNIYEHYREADVDAREPLSGSYPGVEGLTAVDEPHPDGTVDRTAYTPAGADEPTVHDFRRADGSVFLRRLGREVRARDRYFMFNTSGDLVGRWRGRDPWIRDWLVELSPADANVFVITDRPFFTPIVRGLPPDRFYLLDLMHNPHVWGDRRWDARLNPVYEEMLGRIDLLDALVSLTGRQREDIVARYGETSNLFVVPNPVEVPAWPDRLPERHTQRFTVVARLEHQKRLEHALRALALARKEEPGATLDVYGHGDQMEMLQRVTRELGLTDAVTFHGFDPAARDSLWTSTAFLLTSRYEGYPLATLESMSHGCPVIGYDLKYGPRDQITDGVDGYLVAERDFRTVARRMVELIRSPELVAKMSTAAREKAAQHSPEAFVRDWKHVLDGVVAQKAGRTRLRRCSLRVARLAPRRDGAEVELVARLRVSARRGPAPLDSAEVTLDAIDTATGAIAPVPATVTLRRRRFTVRARFDARALFAGEPGEVRLRLRLVWRNSAWQDDAGRLTVAGDDVRVVTGADADAPGAPGATSA